jgi:hypothetical protein
MDLRPTQQGLWRPAYSALLTATSAPTSFAELGGFTQSCFAAVKLAEVARRELGHPRSAEMVAKWVEGLELVERLAGELLVRRPGVAESYTVNQTATDVFYLCAGVDQLVDAGLVVLDGPPPVAMTPRALMRQLSLSGAAEALLPLVETIPVIPAAGPQQPVSESRAPGDITPRRAAEPL